MTVKQLIELLQKVKDQQLPVVIEDNDGDYYPLSGIGLTYYTEWQGVHSKQSQGVRVF